MMMFVFPGQGAQTIGMGKALYDYSATAREIFGEADEALKQKLSDLMFHGDPETLTLTENAQPALATVSAAILAVLEKECGFDYTKKVSYAAGHSLGEYAAYYAGKSFTLLDTVKLLKLRGQAMQKAVPPGVGAMSAILGLSFEAVEAITEEAAQGEVCAAANDNSDGQIVISGHAEAVSRASALAKAQGAKRVIPLTVSAPFHCALMAPAAEAMEKALSETPLASPAFPIIANFSAEPVTETAEIKDLLVKQVTGRVRWRETMQKAQTLAVTHVVEVGTGKVLSGLFKRACKDMTVSGLETPEEIENFIKNL